MKKALVAAVLTILCGVAAWWGIAMSSGDRRFVYEMQEGAGVEEIRRSIMEMDYASRVDLSQGLVVEGESGVSMDTLWNVLQAVGRAGAYQFVLREKDGSRSVELSLLGPDGMFGTRINVEVVDGAICHGGKKMTQSVFRDFVRSAVERASLPLRIHLVCRGCEIRPVNKIRDLLDAVDLLNINGLKAEVAPDLRFVLLDEEDALLLGEQGTEPVEEQGNGDD